MTVLLLLNEKENTSEGLSTHDKPKRRKSLATESGINCKGYNQISEAIYGAI